MLIGLPVATACPAANIGHIATLTNDANRLGLAAEAEWLALGHYEPSRSEKTTSYVDDAAFFLDPDGHRNPAAELTATIAASVNDPATACRFVARNQWLGTRLPGYHDAVPLEDCTEYRDWRAFINADSAVLVFAASYLNSPSSMYGHTFLRIDPPDVTAGSPLLSMAVNFGASIPPSENGLIYAYRGLFGGYPGLFTASRYYEKMKEYSRIDNRDLWEYRLNLTPEELDRMLAHIWELRDINFDYFFFDENCSLRLLELLDVARPGLSLAEPYKAFAIPIDTVRSALDADMVRDVFYRPSNLGILQFEINALSASDQTLARQLSDDIDIARQSEFASLPPARRQQVAQVAYQYLRYRAAGEARDESVAERSFDLLQLVNETNGDTSGARQWPSAPLRPDLGHRTMLVSGALGTEEDEAFGDFEWRLSYHDLADPPGGYPAGASLNMGRLVVRAKEGGSIRLQRLDIIEIASLAPANRFFNPLSWRVNFGWERRWTNGRQPLATQVNGGVGKTYALTGDSRLFGLLTGRLEYNKEMDQKLDIAPGLAAGLLIPSRMGQTLITADQYWFTDGLDRTELALTHGLTVGSNTALRLNFKRTVTDTDRIDEISLGYRHYF